MSLSGVSSSTGSSHVTSSTNSSHVTSSTGSSHVTSSTGSTRVTSSTGSSHVTVSTTWSHPSNCYSVCVCVGFEGERVRRPPSWGIIISIVTQMAVNFMYLLKSLSFKGGIMVREQSVPCIA